MWSGLASSFPFTVHAKEKASVKKVVVHIHNGILLSYLKECILISSNEVDETGAYYTE